MKTMPAQPEYLRATFTGRAVKVDRDKKALLGYVVAQEGPFKDKRGEFNAEALSQIAEMGNAARGGLKSRFTHGDLSGDGTGKFLGRARDFSLSTAVDARTGKKVKAVRADLHFDPTAFDTPHGNLADYVMRLAESDPDALSSSLVIQPRAVERLDARGHALTDEDGEPLPPLWFPQALHGSDIVDTGDAVDGLLSAPQLAEALAVGMTPDLQKALKWDNVVRLSSQLLDGLFAGQSREVVEARVSAYLARYLARRFGEEASVPAVTPRLDALSLRLQRMALAAATARADRK